MSSPVAAPEGSGKTGRRLTARGRFLALLAIVSVVALTDSEILAIGIPGISAGADMMHLPAVVAYVAIGVLSVLTLWLTVVLARNIWRVEQELNSEG
jgi:hypothetical protein